MATALLAAGCATLPGADYPKPVSAALTEPATTRLGREVEALGRKHPGLAGIRLLPSGGEALRTRVELAAAAERTLDLQYFIIENDVTGKLLMDTVLRAADRGVRVRMLVDDAEDITRNKPLIALAAHPGIEIRVFNPWHARGVLGPLRDAEWLVDQRLNYRMHNKLFVADNAAAVLGGRNIGDEYFAASPHTERADFDVLVAGPIVRRISASFDAYWNSDLAVPAPALLASKPTSEDLAAYRAELEQNRKEAQALPDIPRLAVADPVRALLGGEGALTWARAELLYDSPDKGKVESGQQQGALLRERLAAALRTVHSELRVVSPYLVPADEGMRLLEDLRSRGVRVRIVTNSLATTDLPIAYSGYLHYRRRMLEDGIELYEVKPTPEAPRAGGHSIKSSGSGRFAVHAKVYVLDRQRVFVGSMNLDYRSLHLNTEIGLLIDSPEIARAVAARFDAIAQPANCYVPVLGPPDATGVRALRWRTEEDGKMVEAAVEPGSDPVRGLEAGLMTLLPIDDLL